MEVEMEGDDSDSDSDSDTDRWAEDIRFEGFLTKSRASAQLQALVYTPMDEDEIFAKKVKEGFARQEAWSAVGKPKVLGADRSPADPATAAGVALQRYAREQERTPVNSSLASQNVRPSTGRSPHGYAPHAGAIVPAESREPPSVPSRQHISEIKELIQEEESIALLKEQVQQ
eukprot:gene16556-19665_t